MRVNFPTVPGVKIIKVGTAKDLDAGQGLNAELSVTKKYYDIIYASIGLRSEGGSKDLFFVKFQHKAQLPHLNGDFGWATVLEDSWYGSDSRIYNISYFLPAKAGDTIRIVGYVKPEGESDFERILDKTYTNLVDVDWGSGNVDILAFYPTLPFSSVDWDNCDTGRSIKWDDLRNYTNSGVILFYRNAEKDGKLWGTIYGSFFTTRPHPGFEPNERYAIFHLEYSFKKCDYRKRYLYWCPITFYDRRNDIFPDGGVVQMLRSSYYSRD